MRHALLLVSALWWMGCPGKPDDAVSRVAPGERALRASRAVVEAGILEGNASSSALDRYTFEIRFNPGRCTSPEFEIYAKGRWTRALLRPEGPQVRVALEALGAGNSGTSVMKIAGVPSAKRFRAPNGVTWPIFEVLELQETPTSRVRAPGPLIGMAPCP